MHAEPPAAPAASAALAGFSLTGPPPGFVDHPWPWYDRLRAESPVHPLGGGHWLLTRHADVVALYRDPAASSDKQREFAPKFGEGTPLFRHHTTSLVFNDPPRHTRVRRVLTGALSARAVDRLADDVQRLVDDLLDAMAGKPAPDAIDDFAARIPVEVIGNLLDVPADERGPLRDWSLAILHALEPAPGPAVLARGHAAVDDFLAWLDTLVARRRARPGDPQTDVLTRLMQTPPDGEPLAHDDLLHNCIFLLNAGHETTTNLIGNGLHALLTHREQWDRLCADPMLVSPAVEELLRYESPLQLNNRQLTAPRTVAGVDLPAGAFVTLGVGAANRDPAVFEAPHTLDLARKPNPHVAFGHGAHACAGLNVARLEARIALATLARRCPRLALAGPPERDPRIRFRGFRRLPVTLG